VVNGFEGSNRERWGHEPRSIARLIGAPVPIGPVVRRRWCAYCYAEINGVVPSSAGPSACSRCAVVEAQRARVNREVEKLPEKFRWARLDAPMVPPDGTLAILSAATQRECLAWLESATQCLFIMGRPVVVGAVARAPTGVGKTSLASAAGRAAAEVGLPILWVRAAELGPTYRMDHHEKIRDAIESIGAGLVVLDGLGKELANAQIGSGVITQRVPAMQEIIARIYELTKTRFVITCDTTGNALEDAYGLDAARRIAEPPNAKRIILGAGS
jgi:hypothetical protein